MNFMDDLGLIALLLIIIFLFAFEILIIAIVAGYIASMLGVTGVLWWAIAIFLFVFINAILGALLRHGK